MYCFLCLGSLILGLIAWILPVVNFAHQHVTESRNVPLFPLISMGACALSLCLLILFCNSLVGAKDWPALMDVSRAMSSISALLLGVTLILNVTALFFYYRKKV
jgi:cytochrome c oxidase subunit 4